MFVFSGKGAAFNLQPGGDPRFLQATKASAESAIHRRHQFDWPAQFETHFQRLFRRQFEFLGRCPRL